MTVDPIAEQRRQDYLEHLYQRSNRANGPKRNLYSGLYQKRIKELVSKDMDEILGPLGDWS